MAHDDSPPVECIGLAQKEGFDMPGMKSWIVAVLTASTLVLGAFPSASAAEYWWAVCYVEEGVGITTYGASWNYPTRAEAKDAACRNCQEHAQGKRYLPNTLICRPSRASSGRNSCFLIQETFDYYEYSGRLKKVMKFIPTVDFESRARAEEWARTHRTHRGEHPMTIELLACAGMD